MIFESVFKIRRIENKPHLAFFLAFSYSLLSVIFSLILPLETSLTAIFLVTIACLPSLNRLLAYEERRSILEIEKKELLQILKIEDPEKYEKIKQRLLKKVKYPLIKEFKNILGVFFFFFLGLLFSYLLLGIFLPQSDYQRLFFLQIAKIQEVRSLAPATGAVISAQDALLIILSNNLKVALFTFFFSLIYGIGAMFILVWNSSILACGISNFIRSEIARIAEQVGAVSAFTYFQVVPIAFGAYMVHGILEILAYFLIAIAGSLISIALAKHGIKSKEFWDFLMNTVDLILISIILLIVAAILEVTLPSFVMGV